MNTVSTGLSTAAATISQSGKKLATGIGDATEQALKLMTEVESTLARLKSTDLPAVLAEMKATSEKLKKMSDQIGGAENAGIILLVFGLLVSFWCFLNSLGQIFLLQHAAHVDDAE